MSDFYDASDFYEAVIPATPSPCDECPWRKDSIPGYLGPHTAEEWLNMAHGEGPIACHKTIKVNDSWEGARQCRGAASYRANSLKIPRNPEIVVGPTDDRVFKFWEFIEHHTKNRKRTS